MIVEWIFFFEIDVIILPLSPVDYGYTSQLHTWFCYFSRNPFVLLHHIVLLCLWVHACMYISFEKALFRWHILKFSHNESNNKFLVKFEYACVYINIQITGSELSTKVCAVHPISGPPRRHDQIKVPKAKFWH